jgi:putative ABC transport system substrate-binding protein
LRRRSGAYTVLGGAAAWPLAAGAQQAAMPVVGYLKRREFITLLGGAAAWPLAARAQQAAMPVVGLLMGRSSLHLSAAFRQGLGEVGFVEGQNVAIEFRYGNGQYDRLPALAAELVQRRVSVIAAGWPAGQAAKSATATIPIVFIGGGDPVREGLVASLNRPGGNLTGVIMLAPDLEKKRLGLLHELVPQASTIAVLLDANLRDAEFQLQEFRAAERHLGLSIRVVSVGSEQDFETAFATLAQERAGALIVAASTFFNTHRDQLVALASRYRIPTIYELREFAAAGGLMSYSPSLTDVFHQAGVYTGRILKGTKPSDLPVLLPTRFDLVINLKTAKALGLEVPPMLLALADEVIE